MKEYVFMPGEDPVKSTYTGFMLTQYNACTFFSRAVCWDCDWWGQCPL